MNTRSGDAPLPANLTEGQPSRAPMSTCRVADDPHKCDKMFIDLTDHKRASSLGVGTCRKKWRTAWGQARGIRPHEVQARFCNYRTDRLRERIWHAGKPERHDIARS